MLVSCWLKLRKWHVLYSHIELHQQLEVEPTRRLVDESGSRELRGVAHVISVINGTNDTFECLCVLMPLKEQDATQHEQYRKQQHGDLLNPCPMTTLACSHFSFTHDHLPPVSIIQNHLTIFKTRLQTWGKKKTHPRDPGGVEFCNALSS